MPSMFPKLQVSALGSVTAELLLRLLKAYSPTFKEEGAVNALMEYASEELGLMCWKDDAGNLIARYGSGDPKIALIGHIDTVEGELPVSFDGGNLRGRGAVDAKGPLASAFVGASSVRDFLSSGTVYLIAAVGEEGPSHGAQQLIKDGWSFHHVIIL
ncbi:MAG: M20/M25/M40 family metallo-hydrolase, partial [Desulfurococcales archaeon]|nr:M20/M25/M40 family metallo-hydrolase [Desulfurococcales archaeon]